MPDYYLDPEAFTRLFASAERNRRSIAAGLYIMAHRIVRTFTGPHDVLEDAASDAVVHCLGKLVRFDRQRDAFAYFSSVIFNSIVSDLRRERRRRDLVLSFGSLERGSREIYKHRINHQEARDFREELRHRRRRRARSDGNPNGVPVERA